MICVIALMGALSATPIEPDYGKVLQKSQPPMMHLGPARIGWNGPEMKTAVPEEPVPGTPFYIISNAAKVRQIRDALTAVAIPDPGVVLAFFATIMLLRKMRTLRGNKLEPV